MKVILPVGSLMQGVGWLLTKGLITVDKHVPDGMITSVLVGSFRSDLCPYLTHKLTLVPLYRQLSRLSLPFPAGAILS